MRSVVGGSSLLLGCAVIGLSSIASASPVGNDVAREAARARAPRAVLVATQRDRFADGDTLVRYGQVHEVSAFGATKVVPVIGRGVTVRMTKGKALTQSDVIDALPTAAPVLDEAAAAHVASRRTSLSVTRDDAHLVVWPLRTGEARLAYAVLPKVPAALLAAPRIVVDALDGSVLEAIDTRRFAKAKMFRSNPQKSPTLETFDLALTPEGTTLTNPFLTSMNCIDNKSVKPVSLQGFKANVHVCDLAQTAKPDANGDYMYEPQDKEGSAEARKDEFAEVSMYFHASRAYAFFRGLQGNPEAQVVPDKPMPVVANLQIPAGIQSFDLATMADPNRALDPFQNAFYSPAVGGLGEIFGQLYGLKSGALWFGQGPRRDYAYDGDVIYHELTHAVVDHTLHLEFWHVDALGAIDAPGAMNEGLADYFSSAITGDPDVGEYASKDISQNLGVIRTLANKDSCPANVSGEVHDDSTLFSGGLWETRQALPEADRPKLDAAFYKAMRTSSGKGDVGFEDVVKLFLDTLTTDLPTAAPILQKAMVGRGVLPSCNRVIDFTGTPIKASGGRGFAAPGVGSVGYSGWGPGIIQIHVKIPGPTTSATLTYKSAEAGGAGGLLGGGTSFTPRVLAKFGKPITWSPPTKEKKTPHDADLDLAPASDSATLEIPEGATDLYLQIANKGDNDGAYDGISVALTPKAVPPAPPPAGPGPNPGDDDDLSGGGCAASANSGTSRGPVGLLALALAAVALRRRRAVRRE